ncbi:uncharacterized protein EV154DRAFT_484863 [Mucor mucedo]|uniref:uncharacterized protein n=1 Tax=Mucor mucedo TaxID=29922 RepID=UPI00221F923F|nr:uncharacterized protein EV154DRAFT_484863 [Mucor mucedo]KAI7887658.1 hypothetical protein EV154DRAFT_484863 [Mucor mucedo]
MTHNSLIWKIMPVVVRLVPMPSVRSEFSSMRAESSVRSPRLNLLPFLTCLTFLFYRVSTASMMSTLFSLTVRVISKYATRIYSNTNSNNDVRQLVFQEQKMHTNFGGSAVFMSSCGRTQWISKNVYHSQKISIADIRRIREDKRSALL